MLAARPQPCCSPASSRRAAAAAASSSRSVLCRATKKSFQSFEAMLAESDVPVLVDFYAVWCGPCALLSPILNEVSGKMGEALRVVKIDTEKYPALASKYNISALPTLVLFKGGKVADRIEGLPSAADLEARCR